VAILKDGSPVPEEGTMESRAVQLAALLHDIDDRKFFPTSQNLDNARAILNQCYHGQEHEALRSLVLEMIHLVSCSSNGNSRDSVPEGKEWMLIPRYADRLEQIGPIGIVRTYQYTVHKGRPLFTGDTARATTEEQLAEIARPEMFERYQVRKTSDTMIDHFYDKLLHVGNPDLFLVKSAFLRQRALKAQRCMVDFLLEFGRTGSVDTARIEEMAKELQE
jgi:uncharacterized protein